MTIERSLLDDIRADVTSLYVCDDARYVEHEEGWVFEGVEAGDLLFELGIRKGDRDVVVQGFEPLTMKVTTREFGLDSIAEVQAAYEELVDAEGVRVVVERAGEPHVIWVTIE